MSLYASPELAAVLGSDDATTLFDLLNNFFDGTESSDGWIPISEDEIQRLTKMDRSRQKAAVRMLGNRGFLKVFAPDGVDGNIVSYYIDFVAIGKVFGG